MKANRKKELNYKPSTYASKWLTGYVCYILLATVFIVEQPVRIFKCPCEGNKYKLAGMPNDKPTLKEKREYGEYIAAGCTVVTIPVKQFREENWEWCDKHF